jgi:hypothetical protein
LIGSLALLGVIGSLVGKYTQKKSLPVKVLQSFSIYDNLNKIITVSKDVENKNLLFLNGARVISILWIVYGHDVWFRFSTIRNWT